MGSGGGRGEFINRHGGGWVMFWWSGKENYKVTEGTSDWGMFWPGTGGGGEGGRLVHVMEVVGIVLGSGELVHVRTWVGGDWGNLYTYSDGCVEMVMEDVVNWTCLDGGGRNALEGGGSLFMYAEFWWRRGRLDDRGLRWGGGSRHSLTLNNLRDGDGRAGGGLLLVGDL
ncbi:hypothetical protein Tco_1162627 [Tanacetum coccineum]